jgi:hypothetical protein
MLRVLFDFVVGARNQAHFSPCSNTASLSVKNQNTWVKLAIFAILQVLGPMLSDVRIAQIATLTQF